MKVPADPVADKLLGNGKSPFFGQPLHAASDLAEQLSVPATIYGRLEALTSRSNQQFGGRVHFADGESVRGVPVVTMVINADVNVDNVTVAQLCVIGDSMATYVIYRGAARFGETPISEG